MTGLKRYDPGKELSDISAANIAMSTGSEIKPVIIAGSGRSGTTWILDGLCAANQRRSIFEPLHPACVGGADYIACQYIEHEAQRGDMKAFFDPLFSGNANGVWIDYRVRTDRLSLSMERLRSLRAFYEWYLRIRKLSRNYRKYRNTLSRPVIVKMIRANLLLGWLKKNYPYEAVLILRHPGAVIESMLRLGGDDWDPVVALEFYSRQKQLLDCFDSQVVSRIGNCNSDLERYMMVWCLENALPVQQAARDGVHVVFYEDLVLRPETTWPALAGCLGLANWPDEEFLARPSQQAAPGRRGDDYAGSKLGRWMSVFSKAEISTMQGLLDFFNVHYYSMVDAEPRRDKQTTVY